MKVSQLVFEDRDSTFRVVLESQPLKDMFKLCADAKSIETGGILIGKYDDSCAFIEEATPPPAGSSGGPNWFKRGTGGLELLLVARWNEDPRTHYVGEWHFHTKLVPEPSRQDMRQMRSVAKDPRYQCEEPLLIIVCPESHNHWVVKMYIFPNGISPSELKIKHENGLEEDETS